MTPVERLFSQGWERRMQDQEERIEQLTVALQKTRPLVAFVAAGAKGAVGRPFPTQQAALVEHLITGLLTHDTGWASRQSCFWHGPELLMDGDYRMCGECGHIWRTKEDLERDVVWLHYRLDVDAGQAPSPVPAMEEVFACPLCTHDF